MSCNSIFANESLWPYKLPTHFNKVHGELGTEEEMKRHPARFDHRETLRICKTQKKTILKASCQVVYLIAREKAPYTSGEKLDQTCCTENVASGSRRSSSEET